MVLIYNEDSGCEKLDNYFSVVSLLNTKIERGIDRPIAVGILDRLEYKDAYKNLPNRH